MKPYHEKTCLMPYANKNGADQPVHLHSLIITFVVDYLDSIITKLVEYTKPSLLASSEAEHSNSSLTRLHSSKDRFSNEEAQCF